MHTRSVLMLYPTLGDPMDGGRQAPLSIGFSRQKYWSGLLFPSPGNLPDPGTEPPVSCVSDIGRQILHPRPLGKPCHAMCPCYPLFTLDYHQTAAATAAKSLQSCPTRCDLIDGSPPGSSVPGILQARTLEWISISFSSAGK